MLNVRRFWPIFFLGFLFASCFQAREPKKPLVNTDWITPTEPSILIDNLRKSIAKVDFNNYQRCIATDLFQFKADPNLLANNLGLFSNWNWEDEIQFFTNLSRSAQPINSANQLNFTNVRIISHNPDSVEYTADYAMAIYHQDTAFKSVNFAGLLSFQMRRNRLNEWQIVQWQDNKTKEQACWTELRQHFFAR